MRRGGRVSSGLHWFLNMIYLVPSQYGAWVEIDVSTNVPSSARGIVLYVRNDATTARLIAKFRKKGSSQDITTKVKEYCFTWVIVPLDNAKKFEAYIQTNAIKIWLAGYVDDRVVLLEPMPELTVSGTDWAEVDVSSQVLGDAVGVIVLIVNSTAYDEVFYAGVRAKGCTQTFMYGSTPALMVTQFAKLDSDKVFEARRSDTKMKFYLVGYFKPPVTLLVEPISILGMSYGYTYRDGNVSSYVKARTDTVLLLLHNPNVGPLDYVFARQKGSADSSQKTMWSLGCLGTPMGISTDKIFQVCRAAAYLVGYGGP